MNLKDEIKNIIIHQTYDYECFKKLLGNREVTRKRVGIIKYSIEQYGYISNPIIVNEKMEIIDGQGRVQALQELGLPVEYRMIPNLGIDECWAMNLKPTGWTTEEYVKSYAERGSLSYKMLLDLKSKYKQPITLVGAVCKMSSSGQYMSEKLRSGEFSITEKEYQAANETLKYLSYFSDAQKTIKGRKEQFYLGISFASTVPGIDKERLLRIVTERANLFHQVSTITAFLAELSQIYNKGLSKNSRLYFDVVFDQKVRSC